MAYCPAQIGIDEEVPSELEHEIRKEVSRQLGVSHDEITIRSGMGEYVDSPRRRTWWHVRVRGHLVVDCIPGWKTTAKDMCKSAYRHFIRPSRK